MKALEERIDENEDNLVQKNIDLLDLSIETLEFLRRKHSRKETRDRLKALEPIGANVFDLMIERNDLIIKSLEKKGYDDLDFASWEPYDLVSEIRSDLKQDLKGRATGNWGVVRDVLFLIPTGLIVLDLYENRENLAATNDLYALGYFGFLIFWDKLDRAFLAVTDKIDDTEILPKAWTGFKHAASSLLRPIRNENSFMITGEPSRMTTAKQIEPMKAELG
ncbi:MAG: hypothetical protein EOM37_07330 [Proteobacteria bacterium]|nr:hypothetical protein [Pseudomonadota bacterium]